jgi:class 3 adenylate cyclase
MAIFMDRHEMRDMTAENVAEAHRKDLEVQGRYGVKYMTYWFDEKRGTGFCLVEAADAATAERVHREAHGQMPATIIPVDMATVEAFLGQISDGKAKPVGEGEPGLRAVMFTDLVGSTEITERLGDLAALELIRTHDVLVRRAVKANLGREIKHTGDGIMAAFEETADAVHAAVDVQRNFHGRNIEAVEKLNVRIGIHAGEPVEHHHDLFGATVQLASRLCGEAEPNEIVVSKFVRDLSGVGACSFVPLGERRLKGVAKPLLAYRLDWRVHHGGCAAF